MQEPLYSCVDFQEEMSSSSVLSKGAQSWGCKRGSQCGILVGQPGAAGSPRSSMSVSPALVPRNALFPPMAARQCLPAGHHPPDAASSQGQQTQSPFPPCTHLMGRPPVQPPEHIPPAPFPRAAHRAGHRGCSTNARDFISEHLTAGCRRAGGVLAPALATAHALTVLGSQHGAHGTQELVQGSVDLWGQQTRVAGGHCHQEALAQQLEGKTMW